MKLHRADLGFIVLVAAYMLICWAICIATGHSAQFSPLMYLGTGTQMSLMFFLVYALYRLLRAAWILYSSLRGGRRPTNQSSADSELLRFARNDGPLKLILDDLKQGPLRAEIWQRAIPVFIAFFFFFSTFTSMKFLIAEIKPFAWDSFFMETDKALHFGTDPWRILQPLFGYPLITKIIAFFYILWLPVFFLVLYWQLFSLKNPELRMRFFYTFALTWAVNGTFLAIFFSSAGPCYFQHVTGSDYYAPLMDYLRVVNEHYKIYSVWTQDALWENYTVKKQMLGGGVSAFPSVHVATVFLFTLLGWHTGKFWFRTFFAFFLIILLGSIHLGWHYAVDGYFAILTTWGLWWISGVLTRRFHS
ncbi:MAG: phosphatase PAP2 family protein [Alphaproteobacteria bacterium]|nr:phosphatase PAP2 family protein [Alphaproteobacteria bacterium]